MNREEQGVVKGYFKMYDIWNFVQTLDSQEIWWSHIWRSTCEEVDSVEKRDNCCISRPSTTAKGEEVKNLDTLSWRWEVYFFQFPEENIII